MFKSNCTVSKDTSILTFKKVIVLLESKRGYAKNECVFFKNKLTGLPRTSFCQLYQFIQELTIKTKQNNPDK